MPATRGKAGLLLLVLALCASLSPAEASLPRQLPDLTGQPSPLELAPAPLNEPPPRPVEAPSGPGFSLWSASPARPGELFARFEANLALRLPELPIAPGEWAGLAETRIPAFALFAPRSRPCPSGVSRRNATGLGLGLLPDCGGAIEPWLSEDPLQDIDSPNLYAFVGWQPNMATDPLGLALGDWWDPRSYADVEILTTKASWKRSGEFLWGYTKGVGKVVAAPGVLTYNATGWLLYETTGGHQYQAQAHATDQLVGAISEDPLGTVAEGVTAGFRQMSHAAASGDYGGLGEGFGTAVGQVGLLAEAAGGTSMTATPQVALATTTGRVVQAGGQIVLETTPNALGAGMMLMSSAANEGGEASEQSASAGTSSAARREAMRREGIPTSQQPSGQRSTPGGRQYEYEAPAPGGGTQKKVVTHHPEDPRHGPHWEAGAAKPGAQDPLGRQRYYNQDPRTGKPKSRVPYDRSPDGP